MFFKWSLNIGRLSLLPKCITKEWQFDYNQNNLEGGSDADDDPRNNHPQMIPCVSLTEKSVLGNMKERVKEMRVFGCRLNFWALTPKLAVTKGIFLLVWSRLFITIMLSVRKGVSDK